MSAATTMGTPLLVIVSGAPGSGKSTFARALADHMRLLHIERDAVFWSMRYTAGQEIDRGSAGIETYYDTLILLLGKGLSVVTDGTLYPGLSEADVREKLLPVARLVNVHCRAEGVQERFYKREVNRPGGQPAWLEPYMERLEQVISATTEPLELGCPRIEVNTSASYEPSIVRIAAELEDRNNCAATKQRPTRSEA